MDWQKQIIAEDYNGNAQRFAADYAEAVEEGRRYTVQWDELALACTTLPNLEQAGHDLIEQYLGYLPHDSCILTQESFIRGLIQAHRSGQLSDTAFDRHVQEHVKLIRNKDMESTFNTYVTTDKTIYHNYQETFIPFGQIVKSRLITFLGYEPKLAHSIVAEMWMRHMIASDTIYLPDTITEVDQKAIAMIKYREILLEKGRTVADASPLLRSN